MQWCLNCPGKLGCKKRTFFNFRLARDSIVTLNYSYAMGLKKAINFHTKHDLVNAEIHYKRALDQGGNLSPILFQNYGSLLKEKGEIQAARSMYQHGLKLFPDDFSILTNQANLELVERPSTALKQYLYIFGRKIILDEGRESLQSSLSAVVHCMIELNLSLIPYQLLSKYMYLVDYNCTLTLYLLQLLYSPELQSYCSQEDQQIQLIFSQIDTQILSYSPADQVELRFALAGTLSRQLKHREALHHYDTGVNLANKSLNSVDDEQKIKLKKSFTNHSWNFSNALIKNQNFSLGWSLYDHGLLAPANGKQRWQRAVTKPFSHKEVPIWKGQPLEGKSLLLLEEQGIGDSMQFISLIPKLFDRSKHIGLLLSKRLTDIYSQSFSLEIAAGKLSLYTADLAISGNLKAESYDFQLPLGSLCKFLFTHPNDFHPRVPILNIPAEPSHLLRSDYISRFNGVKRIIGISWRGGGIASRIKMKSLDPNMFLNILKGYPDVVFVSLQYGETGSTTNFWNSLGTDVNLIYDDRFDAVKDIKSWLTQVQCCDAVVSVANTTIHGAGGLNIPTTCLLSRHDDWRWLSNPSIKRSYWYPSVGISRQDVYSASWGDAINQTRAWISDGCPMPVGPDHV